MPGFLSRFAVTEQSTLPIKTVGNKMPLEDNSEIFSVKFDFLRK